MLTTVWDLLYETLPESPKFPSQMNYRSSTKHSVTILYISVMGDITRRTFVSGLVSTSIIGLSGCNSNSGSQSEPSPRSSTEIEHRTETSTDVSSTENTTTRTPTETPVFRGTMEGVSETCPLDDFVGYTGTTPVPAPQTPESLTNTSVQTYALEYERFYLQYQALYEYGLENPDSTAVPVHDFPEIRMQDVSQEILASEGEQYIIHIEYRRTLAEHNEGWFTVNYVISSEDLVRAGVPGTEHPGPNPYQDGEVIACR